jgi:hypothetical protein
MPYRSYAYVLTVILVYMIREFLSTDSPENYLTSSCPLLNNSLYTNDAITIFRCHNKSGKPYF